MSPSARGSPSGLRPRSWPAEPSACDSQSSRDKSLADGCVSAAATPVLVVSGFRPELEQTLRNLSNVLADAGVTREQVIKVNVYLADLADWSALNGPYAEFFGSSLPARTAFAASALPLGARVEIEAWAVVEETR